MNKVEVFDKGTVDMRLRDMKIGQYAHLRVKSNVGPIVQCIGWSHDQKRLLYVAEGRYDKWCDLNLDDQVILIGIGKQIVITVE
jgi:hypothetical protein